MSQVFPNPAKEVSSLKRVLIILIKNFDCLVAAYLARYLVWRELRKRQKAEAKRRRRTKDLRYIPDDAVTRLRSREQERYLTEVAKNRRIDK
jgi:hypothetical protein